MLYLITLPFLVQGVVIALDEWLFHRKRGLPRWERIGHALDTLTVLCCLGFVLIFPYSPFRCAIYIGLSIFSCVFITKDEFVHKECCPAAEQWLHAFLFLNHPVLLAATGLIWPTLHGSSAPAWLSGWMTTPEFLHRFLVAQFAFASLLFLYQVIYWNFVWKEKTPPL